MTSKYIYSLNNRAVDEISNDQSEKFGVELQNLAFIFYDDIRKEFLSKFNFTTLKNILRESAKGGHMSCILDTDILANQCGYQYKFKEYLTNWCVENNILVNIGTKYSTFDWS